MTLHTIEGVHKLKTKAYEVQYRREEPTSIFVDPEIKTYKILLRFYLIFN